MDRTGFEIAVIGMSCRFPDAENIDEFWKNLQSGVESLEFLTDEELVKLKVSKELINNPNYVNSKGGHLKNKNLFDAGFFNYTPNEAEIMNPQHRIFHHVVWEALENAGYDPFSYIGKIGLYGSGSSSFYWEALNLLSGQIEKIGSMAAQNLIQTEHICMRIAYALNLKGPVLSLNSACSSSLVAIHLACRSLLLGECNLALAGGVRLSYQERKGYLYQDGKTVSKDGHCKSFDCDATGFVGGDGAGAVVLKQLEDSIADGDTIYAVIKATSINNDGQRKVGYSAPSIEGQADVISSAIRLAEVSPEDITYVETHGTATSMGDPIEIEGLISAFDTEKRNYCGLGSVKTNIGHLDAAAGVASFIKAVLSIKNKKLVPTLHFKKPNPKIDFENSPFYVNNTLKNWNCVSPLRAGVSSLGIGGTNAHAILEEYISKYVKTNENIYNILIFSAKSQISLDNLATNFKSFLVSNPDVSLSDAAYTLGVGRTSFGYRAMLVCQDKDSAIKMLDDPKTNLSESYLADKRKRIYFLFAGIGSQYKDMGYDLYRTVPFFKGQIDNCAKIIKHSKGGDILEYMYSKSQNSESHSLSDFHIAQLAIFSFEYSLSKLLINWGVSPDAVLGYSFGEYIAACISEVFSLEDAIDLIIFRGELIQKTKPGLMLSVPIKQEELLPCLNNKISLAIDNGPSCVVSGESKDIIEFEIQLKQKRIICVNLNAEFALHSKLMEPVSDELIEKIEKIKFNEIQTPVLSNVTGKWLDDKTISDPEYWVKQLCGTVKYASCVEELKKKSNAVFIEIGPGFDLSTLLKHHISTDKLIAINTVRNSKQNVNDYKFLLGSLGKLWLSGVKIDWQAVYANNARKRIPLPTYPFEYSEYRGEGELLDKGNISMLSDSLNNIKQDILNWFYLPSWKLSPLPLKREKKTSEICNWLIFSDDFGISNFIEDKCIPSNHMFISVKKGNNYQKNEKEYYIDPSNRENYFELLKDLQEKKFFPDNILHLWTIDKIDDDKILNLEEVNKFLKIDFFGLIYLTQAVGKNFFDKKINISILTNYQNVINTDDILSPIKSTLNSAVEVIPKEYPNINCSTFDIDIDIDNLKKNSNTLSNIIHETIYAKNEAVAYRNERRWTRTFEYIKLDSDSGDNFNDLPENGVYIIPGGLGGMGYVFAEHLSKSGCPKIVLIGKSQLPEKYDWDEYLISDNDSSIKEKIEKIIALEKLGGKIKYYAADVSNSTEIKRIAFEVKNKYGKIDGLFYAAGVADGCVIPLRTWENTRDLLESKVLGTLAFDELLDEINPRFYILCSSISSYMGAYGQIGYCAVNSFQDAYANLLKIRKNKIHTIAINWDMWSEIGMGFDAVKLLTENGQVSNPELLLQNGISSKEGIEVIKKALEYNFSQLVVSVTDLKQRIIRSKDVTLSNPQEKLEITDKPKESLVRFNLSSEYVEPTSEMEIMLVKIFEDYVGYNNVGVDDNFFEIGLTSLTLIQLNNVLRETLQCDIPIALMFEYPSIRLLTSFLSSSEEEEEEINSNTNEDLLFEAINLFEN